MTEYFSALFIHYTDITMRIVAACLLGGIIGYERESANRPAGFRTHILVCVGAAMVMLTGEFVHRNFGGTSDPARLGAQVVSGIGFLGAGTILRAGLNVRGLTTAASLWAVSCIGLACGIGFYSGAVITTAVICTTLGYFKRFEEKLWRQNTQKTLLVTTDDVGASIDRINDVFEKYGVEIKRVELLGKDENGDHTISFALKMPNCSIPELYGDLQAIDHVKKILLE